MLNYRSFKISIAVLVFSFGLSAFVNANEVVAVSNTQHATVIKVHGDVSKLLPGQKEAKKIFLNDRLPEDTSLVTGPKSYLRVKFDNQTEMTLGPSSKMVLSLMGSSRPSVISLLKGSLRSFVQKHKNGNEHKLFIKTQTAAMGVRGTDFISLYNPENKISSVLTFSGGVAFSKIDEFEHSMIEDELNDRNPMPDNENKSISVSRQDHSNKVIIVDGFDKTNSESAFYQKVEKILTKKSATIVEMGQISQSVPQFKNASKAQAISPEQYYYLERNKNLIEAASDEVSVQDAKTIAQSQNAIAQLNFKSLESFKSEDGRDFTYPRHSMIDLETGLVLSSKNMGQIDPGTGRFIAPAGLKLSATEGFMVKDAAIEDIEIYKKQKELNDILNQDYTSPLKEDLQAKVNQRSFVLDELKISFMMPSYESIINHHSESRFQYNAHKPFLMAFDWNFSSTSRLRPTIGLVLGHVDYRSESFLNASFAARSLFSMKTGLDFDLHKYLLLNFSLHFNQDQYLERSSTQNAIRRVYQTELHLGGTTQFNIYKKLWADLSFGGIFLFSKSINTLMLNGGFGHYLELGPRYFLNSKNIVSIHYKLSRKGIRIESEGFSDKLDRNIHGLNLNYSFLF